MRGIRLPFYAPSGQIPLSIITFFSCGLSLWLTVRFCANLAPGYAAAELLAMGLIWELAKLTFGTLGSRRVKSNNTGERAAGYALLSVSLILAVGSVVASLAFLMQADQHVSRSALRASEQALHASEGYERESAGLRALDEEIKELMAMAEQYRGKGLLTQGVRTLDRVRSLRQERQGMAQALAGREGVIGTADAAAVGLLLLGNSPAWRFAAQFVLAVMLEVVSMIALSLLCNESAKTAKGDGAAPGGPQAKVVRLKVASTRIASDARPYRAASEAAPGSANASGHQTLLHRIGADTAPQAMRITCHTHRHRPASHEAVRDLDVRGRDVGWRCMGEHVASQAVRTACDATPFVTARRSRDAHRLRILHAQAKELVRTAQMRPRYRDMQRALGASQQVVQRILRDLVAEGVLCRQGTAYALVSPLDANGGAV